MAKCPRVVKINGYRWDLHTDARSWAKWGTDTSLGRTFPDFKMVVQPGVMHPQEEASTVLHELLHATWKHSFPGDTVDTPKEQEEAVAGIEFALYSALRDNPRLVAYLQSPEPL